MRAKTVQEVLDEGYGTGFGGSYGAGYSYIGGTRGMISGTRGGFGGANNLGGPNMMYTYEIKPLNHTLEQLPNTTTEQSEQIQIGSKVEGCPIRSNATPDKHQKIIGIVHKIVTSNENEIKYYVVQDEATATLKRLDPLTTKLLTYDPVTYYYDASEITPHSRRRKNAKPSIQRSY